MNTHDTPKDIVVAENQTRSRTIIIFVILVVLIVGMLLFSVLSLISNNANSVESSTPAPTNTTEVTVPSSTQ